MAPTALESLGLTEDDFIQPAEPVTQPAETVIPAATEPVIQQPVEPVSTHTGNEPAPVAEPVSNEPAPAAPVQTTMQDLSPVLKGIFGDGIDTADAAKDHIAKLQSTIESLQNSQAEVGKPVHEKVQKFGKFTEEMGTDDFGLFQQILSIDAKAEATDPVEILITQAQILEKRSFTEQEKSDYRLMYSDMYKLDGEKFSEDEMRIGKIQMNQAVRAARGEITSVQEKLAEVGAPVQPVATLDTIKQNWETWAPKIQELQSKPESSVLSSTIKFEAGQIKLAGDKPLEVDVKFDIPKEKMTGYYREIMKIQAQNGTAPSDESLKAVQQYVQYRGLTEFYPEIMRKAVQVAFEKASELSDAFIHNPSALQTRTDVPGADNQPKDEGDRAWEAIKKANPHYQLT